MQVLKTEKLDQLNLETLSPMMKQYVELKRKHDDCLIFFRLGDFYELFFDDAILAAEELDIALTGRDCGQAERAAMCGVPHHAAESYLQRLVEKGYKVGICEQLEDPSQTKGLVQRGLVRVVSPGTITNPENLDASRNNFLLCIYAQDAFYGLSAVDLSTGECFATCLMEGKTEDKLLAELARYQPSELICNRNFADSPLLARYLSQQQLRLNIVDDQEFMARDAELNSYLQNAKQARQLGDRLWPEATTALLAYAKACKVLDFSSLLPLVCYRVERYLEMDAACRRNLELCQSMREQKKYASLLWVIDFCRSAMGQRRLRQWLEQPLFDLESIHYRQDAVAELKDAYLLRQELREQLYGLHDLGRLANKISRGQVNARDLLALARVLERLPAIQTLLKGTHCTYLQTLATQVEPHQALCQELFAAIDEEAGVTITEGGLIKSGYSETIDRLRDEASGGRQWILDLEEREKETTGIRNLKVGYNRVFGYYIEVSKSNYELVPAHYMRKQTLASAERYITDELKQMEDRLLSSKQRLQDAEYQCFCTLREAAKAIDQSLYTIAEALAQLDCLQSLAEVAERNGYTRPELSQDETLRLEIVQGRHPVVEKLLDKGQYVPNDCFLDASERLMVLTGPNMGGKSTYMRQVALIVVLAQMGAFVPAQSAKLSLVDRLFTRIGASDDLATGDSTFMLEMREMASILRQASPRSLLILDEVGRGTSTYDGLSIAWAILERIADPEQLGARTLFATHYHELTALEQSLDGVFNAHVQVQRQGERLRFLHRIARGGADESYGIEVAALAELPTSVVNRAHDLLLQFERQGKKAKRQQHQQLPMEQNLFSAQLNYGRQERLLTELKSLDIAHMNFMEAASTLHRLHEQAKALDE